MCTTRVGPVNIDGLRAYKTASGSPHTFEPATGWLAAVVVMGEIRFVLTLRGATDENFQATIGIQTAETDPNDSGSWGLYTGSPTYVSIVGDKIYIRIAAPAFTDVFWIRFGVAASLKTEASAGDQELGDVTFLMSALSG